MAEPVLPISLDSDRTSTPSFLKLKNQIKTTTVGYAFSLVISHKYKILHWKKTPHLFVNI